MTGTMVENGRETVEPVKSVAAKGFVRDLVELEQVVDAKDTLILEKLRGGGCQRLEVLTFQTHGGCSRQR